VQLQELKEQGLHNYFAVLLNEFNLVCTPLSPALLNEYLV